MFVFLYFCSSKALPHVCIISLYRSSFLSEVRIPGAIARLQEKYQFCAEDSGNREENLLLITVCKSRQLQK